MHLHAAAARGDLTGMRFALDHGTPVDAHDASGNTALYHALNFASLEPSPRGPKARLDTIQYRLAAGANVCAKNEFGRQPVHAAAQRPDLAFLDLLVAHGADLKSKAESGYTTLLMAAFQPAGPAKIRMFQRLADAGVELNAESECSESALSVTLCQGDFDALRWLLQRGADPSVISFSPLHLAVALGSLDEVAALAHSSSAINAANARFRTSPWLLALRMGDMEKIELLAKRGADLRQTGNVGLSPLHLAAAADSPATAWLIEHGADIHVLDDFGNTPLHSASEANALGAIRLLLAAGAEPDRLNSVHARPLHLARSLPTLQLLAKTEQDLNAIDGCGDWPLKHAAEDNDWERATWLLHNGAQVDLTSTGETALHAAVRSDAREIIAELLAAGANPNAQDVDGWTPFFSARSREAIHQLRAAGGNPLIGDDTGSLPSKWLNDPLLRAALGETIPPTTAP